MAETPDDLERRVDRYMKERVDQYANWYDGKAVRMKSRFFRARIITAVSAVLIPFLSNLSFSWTLLGVTVDVARVAVSLIGLVVALLVALEGVLRYREQWTNYRATEQYIGGQRQLFLNRVGEYAEGSPEDAFKLLVRNVERAIKEENEVTLNILSRADAPEALPPKKGEGI